MTDPARRPRWWFAALGVVLAAALAARVAGAAAEDPWIDEVISLNQSDGPAGDVLRRLALADVHPPGFVAALATWRSVAGSGTMSARGLPIAAGLLAVGLVAWLGGVGPLSLAAALLLAVHAGHVHFSQEIRGYALLSAWSLAAAAIARALASGRLDARLGGAVLAAGLWLHHAAWPFLFGGLAGVAWSHAAAAPARRLARAGVTAVLVAAPWWVLAVHQATGLPEAFVQHQRYALDPDAMVRTLGPWGGVPSFSIAAVGAALLAVAVLLALVWPRSGAAPPPQPSTPAGPAPPGRRRFAAVGWPLLAGAAACLLATPLPLAVAATPMQEALIGRALALGLPVLAAAPLLVTGALHLAAWFGGRAARRPRDPLVAFFLGATAGSLALIAVAGAGQMRNHLPLVPLALVAAVRAAAPHPLLQRAGLAVALVLIGVAAPTVVGHAERIQPRGQLTEALRRARDSGYRAVAVISPFDAPAVRHAAIRMGLGPEFVRPAEARPPRLRHREALLLSYRGCRGGEPAVAEVALPDGRIVPVSPIDRLRAACLFRPPLP